MPVYRNAQGQEVTADEAYFRGSRRLRDGYTAIMREGEWLGFEAALMDAAPASATIFLTDTDIRPKSIDEALKQKFAEGAKRANQQQGEYLKGLSPEQIEATIAEVARDIVLAGSAEGVAAVLSFDRAAEAVRVVANAEIRLAVSDAEVQLKVAEMRASHTRKHAFMGDRAPVFDVGAATLIAQSQIHTADADVRNSIRDSYYHG